MNSNFEEGLTYQHTVTIPAGQRSVTVEVTADANSTQGELTRVAVNRDQFDSEGWATVTVPVTLLSDTINVRFQVLAGKNRKVGVAGICYWQTPA